MSVKLMATIFMADIQDLIYHKDGEDRRAKASTVKLMLLAYADHANDDGEAAYPGYTRLERKTALSRQGISDTLEAITQNNFMTLTGVSNKGTNSYQMNIELLESLVKPLDQPKKELVKPLDYPQSSHLTSASQATGLKPSITTSKPSVCRQKPEKRSDLIDGMLHYARLAADPANAMKMRIAEYPADVQDTLTALSELYFWPVGSIPERPKSGHGGKYAQWIMELREINGIIAGYGREALEASVAQCDRLSISHPAGITWCLAGEIGKLAKRAKFTPTGVDTALTRQLENFTPRKPAEERRTQASA
jgi:hypothetical protein